MFWPIYEIYFVIPAFQRVYTRADNWYLLIRQSYHVNLCESKYDFQEFVDLWYVSSFPWTVSIHRWSHGLLPCGVSVVFYFHMFAALLRWNFCGFELADRSDWSVSVTIRLLIFWRISLTHFREYHILRWFFAGLHCMKQYLISRRVRVPSGYFPCRELLGRASRIRGCFREEQYRHQWFPFARGAIRDTHVCDHDRDRAWNSPAQAYRHWYRNAGDQWGGGCTFTAHALCTLASGQIVWYSSQIMALRRPIFYWHVLYESVPSHRF